MKIVCTQENLKLGLTAVSRIISSSSTLPILSNVLLKTENGMLKISSTNLEIAITTHIRCKIEAEGEVAVNSKTLSDLVNNLPNKNLSLTQNPGQINIETENHHTTVKTLPAEDFPLIPNVESRNTLKIDGQTLKKSLEQVFFAVSTNQTQPEIAGVLFSLEGQELRIVATDRYRLAEKKITLEKKSQDAVDVIVPQKTAVEISRIIGNSNDSVDIVFGETQISFSFGGTKVVSRVVDGQYPDYKLIIPTNFGTVVTMNRGGFVNALRASGVFSRGTNSVKIDYSNKGLVLTTESQELGKSVVELEAEVLGKNGTVILNNHYVLDCLMAMETEKIILKITDESSPGLILPDGDNSYVYLVMPIKN